MSSINGIYCKCFCGICRAFFVTITINTFCFYSISFLFIKKKKKHYYVYCARLTGTCYCTYILLPLPFCWFNCFYCCMSSFASWFGWKHLLNEDSIFVCFGGIFLAWSQQTLSGLTPLTTVNFLVVGYSVEV